MENADVTRFLVTEHEEADALFDVLAAAIQRGSREDARVAFYRLSRRLYRHIDAEERALFPALHGASASSSRLIATMVREHFTLRERAAEVGRALARGDLVLAWDAFVELSSFLLLHNEKEERVICPAVHRALGSVGVRSELVQRMHALCRTTISDF